MTFYTKTDRFTKTSSGQTQGKHSKQRWRVFLQAVLSIGSVWMLAWVDPWKEREELADAAAAGKSEAERSRRRKLSELGLIGGSGGGGGGGGGGGRDYSKAHTVHAKPGYDSHG
jgi:hypothetical protein